MRFWPLRLRITRPQIYGPRERLRDGTPIRYLERGWKVERWGPRGTGHSESLSLRFAWKHAPSCSPGPGWFGPMLLVLGAVEAAEGYSGMFAAFIGIAWITAKQQGLLS